MTTATVRQEILNSGGNDFVATVLTSENFAKYYAQNVAKGFSSKEAMEFAFNSCQKDTLAFVNRPEVISYIAETTYNSIRATHLN